MAWLNTNESMRWRTAPDFKLPSADGFDLSLSSFWYRSNMVLLFCPPRAAPKLIAYREQLVRLNDAIRLEAGKLVLLVDNGQHNGRPESLPRKFPFPVLYDHQGTVRGLYRATLPGEVDDGLLLFVLDRYGAIFAAYREPRLADPLPGKEILEWLRYIDLQCPE